MFRRQPRVPTVDSGPLGGGSILGVGKSSNSDLVNDEDSAIWLTAGQRVFTLKGGGSVIVLPARSGDGGIVMFDFFAGSDTKLDLYASIAVGGLMVAFGILGAAVANRRGRGPVIWGLVSLLFVPVGFLLLICLPKSRCHPVWQKAETDATPESDHESVAELSEDATPPRRRPSGNGELRHGNNNNNSAGMELADRMDDPEEPDFLESRMTTPDIAITDTPQDSLEVDLLTPRMTIADVAPPEPVPSDNEADLLQPLTAPPSVLSPQAGNLAPATSPTPATPAAATPPAPRRGRVPGGPAGCTDFQVRVRGEKKIELQCRNCSAVFRRPNGMRGKLEKCPECRAVMRIPK